MARPPDPTAKISLLRASEEVFAEVGLTASKVEEIARRAGLSKGAFYLHFESKDEAFKQVVESFLARLATFHRPPQEIEDRPDTPERMVAFWLERDAQIFEFLWQNRAIVTILGSCQGQHAYLFDTYVAGVRQTSIEWLEHFRGHKLVRPDLETELVSALLWGAYHELTFKMLAAKKRPPIDEWLRQTLSIFLRGIGTPALLTSLGRVDGAPRSGRAASHRPRSNPRTRAKA